MRPEAKIQFDLAAKVLDVPPDKRDRAWAQMMALGLSPDDPTNIYLVLSCKMELAVEAFDDIPERVEEAAKRAVGPVAKAASAAIVARMAERNAEADELFARAMSRFDRRAKKVLGSIHTHVLGLATDRFRSAKRNELVQQVFHLAAVAAIVLACGLSVVAWTFHGIGFSNGQAQAAQVADGLSTLAGRSDVSTILILASHNPDFADSLVSWCGSGNRSNLLTIEGSRRCGPFWIDAPPLAEAAPVSLAAFWNFANAPLRRVDPLFMLAAGLVSALLMLRFHRSK